MRTRGRNGQPSPLLGDVGVSPHLVLTAEADHSLIRFCFFMRFLGWEYADSTPLGCAPWKRWKYWGFRAEKAKWLAFFLFRCRSSARRCSTAQAGQYLALRPLGKYHAPQIWQRWPVLRISASKAGSSGRTAAR